ncbi:MAG: anaerobic carbon-monoxide dehydrogenase catalytic subunit [bacterium]|nr:anaerobic carbon-monoxide dehydrogenase catalytic subunit [bacterium]
MSPRHRNTSLGFAATAKQPGAKPRRDADARRTQDPAACELLEEAQARGITTAFDRFIAQQPQCGFGLDGVCCRVCLQGPCRINPRKAGMEKGICGAQDYTVVARNLARAIAGGTACHSDHGRHIAKVLLHVAEGEIGEENYRVSDPEKLRRIATRIGLETEGVAVADLARRVALAALADYGRHTDETCTWLTTTITPGRQTKFKHCAIAPTAIDRSITDIITQTAMGMDADPVNIIFGGLKTALSDYTGMHLSTDLSDVLFGTPTPVLSQANLGVIDPAYVNIATHGHNPTLSSLVVDAAQELAGEARQAGAKGVNVVGICCTGNELLMRDGVYLASNVAGQELAIMTGALDAMIVDIQCIMPSVRAVAECYHTAVIATNPLVKIPGAHHVDFREETALATAKEMVRLAIRSYGKRDPAKLRVSEHKQDVVAGWSLEALFELLGRIDADHPARVLTDAILEGEIRGVALFAGCNNLKVNHDQSHLAILKGLLANDVFVVATGCSAGAAAKAGLMAPGSYEEYGGEGLKKFLARLSQAGATRHGLPAVFHLGSCVDNTRAADLWTAMARELDVDVPKVPFVASAPEAMHEKAVSIGSWVVAMGIPTHVGIMPQIEGSELVYGVGTQIAHDVYGGYFILDPNPTTAVERLLDALEYRVWKLRVHRKAADRFGAALTAGY